MADQSLSGFHVLDVSQGISGPYCTKLLADFGANVLKIEPPGQGDPARRAGPFPQDQPDPEKSGLFLYLNTNKRDITLDLHHQTGAEIFKRLVKEADVVVESFAPGTMSALGLEYKVLSQINPQVVMVSLSPFGQYGPYRDYKATELTTAATGGGMFRRGIPGREPIKAGGNLAQYVTGLWGALAALAALYGREATGQGDYIDISAQEAQIPVGGGTFGFSLQQSLGTPPLPRGPLPFPGTIQAKDGWIGVNPLSQTHRQLLLEFMGIRELQEDPRFATTAGWRDHVEELAAKALPWFAAREKEKLMVEGQARKIPINLVPGVDELVHSAHLKERRFFVEQDHPAAGKVVHPGAPFRLPESPWQLRRPAPTLGQHNREVYCDQLGYTLQDLVHLRATSIV